MRDIDLPLEVRYPKPASRPLVTTFGVVTVAAVFGLAALWYTNVFDDYTGSCKFADRAEPIAGGNVAGPPEPTPERAIAAFASQPWAGATGQPVPIDGWHEHRGRWVRDISSDQFLQISVTEHQDGWVVTSAISCYRT